MSLILTPDQAQAVYSAMCVLNNVGGTIAVILQCNGKQYMVSERTGFGVIRIEPVSIMAVPPRNDPTENYPDQAAFAAAYGLDHADDYQNAVQAAAGGLTQKPVEY